MSLRDLVDRKSVIKDEKSGVEFEVRGLSLEDIVLLLDNHKDALVHIFSSNEGTDFAELVKSFPGFVAAAIAYAADEHELEDKVLKLPVGIQLRAIQEVWELSSLDVETVGKLASGIVQGLSKLNADELQSMTARLTTGLPASQPEQSSLSPMDIDPTKSSDIPSGG